MATTQKQKIADLCAILTQVEDPKDMRALLEDLCTQKEVENMAERIFAAKLLLEGKTYNEVVSQSNISSATLSRVSRSLQNGTGYKKQLKK
jgi:TrpR-related protein YerC/YecD